MVLCVQFPLVIVALDGSCLMFVMGGWESKCYPYLYVVAVKVVSSCFGSSRRMVAPICSRFHFGTMFHFHCSSWYLVVDLLLR